MSNRLASLRKYIEFMDFPYIFTQHTGILLRVELLFTLLIFPQLCQSTLLHYLQDLHLHSIQVP